MFTTTLRFQKLEDKFETLALIKVIVDVLLNTVLIDEFIVVRLVLNDTFVISIESTDLETFVNEEDTICNVEERFLTLALRSQQFAETFIQHEFKYP